MIKILVPCFSRFQTQPQHQWGFPFNPVNKEPARNGFYPWVRKIPWRRKWQPTPTFLAWRIPWIEEPGRLQSMGPQESGMTQRLNHYHLALVVDKMTSIDITIKRHVCIETLGTVQKAEKGKKAKYAHSHYFPFHSWLPYWERGKRQPGIRNGSKPRKQLFKKSWL